MAQRSQRKLRKDLKSEISENPAISWYFLLTAVQLSGCWRCCCFNCGCGRDMRGETELMPSKILVSHLLQLLFFLFVTSCFLFFILIAAFTQFLFKPFVGHSAKCAGRIYRSQRRFVRESSEACSPTADRQLTFGPCVQRLSMLLLLLQWCCVVCVLRCGRWVIVRYKTKTEEMKLHM